MSCKRITRSCGTKLPRKLSGKMSVSLAPDTVPRDPSRRYSNARNDSSNNEAQFSNRKHVISMSISHIRPGLFSTSKMLSSSSTDSGDRYQIMTGRWAGQKSGMSRIGFVFVETIRKSRRRGYVNTTNLHLLHTCASLHHFHGPGLMEASR